MGGDKDEVENSTDSMQNTVSMLLQEILELKTFLGEICNVCDNAGFAFSIFA